MHSPQIAAKLADLGLLGLSIPERYGGSGGDLFDAILFVEAMSRGRAPVPSYPVTLIVAHSYLKFAAEDMKREVLSGVAAGTPTSIAMSEPGSGSDVASLIAKADKVEGGYVLNGQKTWCSNAHLADFVLVVRVPPTPAPSMRASRCSACRSAPRACRSTRSTRWVAARSTTSISPIVSFPRNDSSVRRARAGPNWSPG